MIAKTNRPFSNTFISLQRPSDVAWNGSILHSSIAILPLNGFNSVE